jgi:hypothetical protein
VKAILSSPCQSRALALPARSRHAFAADAATGSNRVEAQILTGPHPGRGLPFLAQYLTQEIVRAGDPPPRWRDRDNAYRLAGNAVPASSVILEV